MADFEKAFAKTIKAEGGYVNNPNDKGGETYMGITRKNHPKLNMWKIIDFYKTNVPNRKPKELNSILCRIKDIQEEVKTVYRKNYWNPIKLDMIYSQRIANQFFDISVNCGTYSAIKAMQRVAGVKETGKLDDKTIDYYVKRHKRKS